MISNDEPKRLGSREVLVDHGELGDLLGAVAVELAADHLDVRVDLLAAVKRVGGAVHADEPLAAGDGVEERLLAVLRHRLAVLVGALGGEVAGGLEGEGVPLADLVGVEEGAVLGGDDLEAVLLAQVGQDPLGVAQLACFPGDDRVLEARALGEEEHFRFAA